MTYATLNTLDHLLPGIPESSALERSHVHGTGLLGALSLLGLDVEHQGKLPLVIKASRFLEALEDIEIIEATVGDESVDLEELDHILLGWNRDLQNPALTLDGSIIEDNQVYSLYGRHYLTSTRANVNGHAVERGLTIQSELDPDLVLLRMIFEFAATPATPKIEIVGELDVLEVLRQLHG